MNTKVESIEDVLPPNINTLALEHFNKFGVAKAGFLNESEFNNFVNAFFAEEKELAHEVISSGHYTQSHKAGTTDGVTAEEFSELFKDLYILKHHSKGEEEPVDITLESKDLF